MPSAALQKGFKAVMKRYDCHSGNNPADAVIPSVIFSGKLHPKHKYSLI
jgi:hypothetical protein